MGRAPAPRGRLGRLAGRSGRSIRARSALMGRVCSLNSPKCVVNENYYPLHELVQDSYCDGAFDA